MMLKAWVLCSQVEQALPHCLTKPVLENTFKYINCQYFGLGKDGEVKGSPLISATAAL